MLMITEHQKVIALLQTTGSRGVPAVGSWAGRLVPGVLFDWTARGNPGTCVLRLLC